MTLPTDPTVTPAVDPTTQDSQPPAPQVSPGVIDAAGEQPAPPASPTVTPATVVPPTAQLPRPIPRPIPKPAAFKPHAPAAAAPVAPAPQDAKAAQEAAAFGRVDDEGNVYVREASGERLVGQVPGATGANAMELYIRRYLELDSRASLLATRLQAPEVKVAQVAGAVKALGKELLEPAAVGDLDGLRARLEQLRAALATKKDEEASQQAAARAQALAARTSIVERAEALVAIDPARTHFKRTGEQLRELLEEWKAAQRAHRLDKSTEDQMWQRFVAARAVFETNRRAHFCQVDAEAAGAKTSKQALVSEAEALATSTDWGPTAAKYRELMTRWKAAGRAGRKEDDELWAAFRAAQDRFFAARTAANDATDAEYQANLEVKLALLTQAEALVPVTNLEAAKAALRDLQDKWEAAGKVPRQALAGIESRLRAVENAVRDAEASKWRASDPEKQARADGVLAQLEAAIASLQADLQTAQAKGDARAAGELEASLAARRAWFEQISKSAAQGL